MNSALNVQYWPQLRHRSARREVSSKKARPGSMLFAPETQQTNLRTGTQSLKLSWPPLLIFSLLASWSRLHQIGRSAQVIWDEAYFGSHISYYLQRKFFFDLHPPLGKLLLTIAALLTDFDTTFDFPPGGHYPRGINYTLIRSITAAFGAASVPLVYLTAQELKLRTPAVWLVTLFVLCENSFILISRFILLDSILLFFTCTTLFCAVKINSLGRQASLTECYRWTVLSGVSIGCIISVKWAGLFTAIMTWLSAADTLRRFLCTAPWCQSKRYHQFAIMAFNMTLLPLLIYTAIFGIHFAILSNSGPGDPMMPSIFQANLKGSRIGHMGPYELAYGSSVTIKNTGAGGGLLHALTDFYPDSKDYQQITTLRRNDDGNLWTIFNPDSDRDASELEAQHARAQIILHLSPIGLVNAMTGSCLHSRSVPAHIMREHYEVSGVDAVNEHDEVDGWIIEIAGNPTMRPNTTQTLRILRTTFRLKNSNLDCYLRSATDPLPSWGHLQTEVTCAPVSRPEAKDIYAHWNIEQHWNGLLRPEPSIPHPPSFLSSFITINKAMLRASFSMAAYEKNGPSNSNYTQWPLLAVGMRLNAWTDTSTRYFLLGNLTVGWGSTAALGFVGASILSDAFGCVIALFGAAGAARKRGHTTTRCGDTDTDHVFHATYALFLSYLVHFLPFTVMDRPTYAHHYHPSLYCAILTTGCLMDWKTRPLSPRSQKLIFGVAYLSVAGAFVLFRATIYGMDGPRHGWTSLKWLNGWDLAA